MTLKGLLLVALVLVAAPVAAQPVPPRVQIIVETLHARHPQLAMGGDDERRELTKMIAEQVVYEHPNEGWGRKSADQNRPPSKDAIARRIGTELIGCDWQDGGSRRPFRPVECKSISDQVFLPLAGVNHLGSSTVDPPPPDVEVVALLRQQHAVETAQHADASARDERIYADLKASIADATAQLLAEVRASQAALSEQLRRHDEDPSFIGKILGNRYVQAALVGVGTWLTQWQMAKE